MEKTASRTEFFINNGLIFVINYISKLDAALASVKIRLSKQQGSQMPPFPAGLFATWFGFGRLRPAPGTWGSAAALPLAWLAFYSGGQLLLLACASFVTLLGILSAELYCRSTDKEDPSEVVIDEVAGQMFALSLVEPSLLSYAFGFLFFRGFDILKPGPIGWADRKVKGGLGVMLDDVLAGLLAAACLFFLGKGTGWWMTI